MPLKTNVKNGLPSNPASALPSPLRIFRPNYTPATPYLFLFIPATYAPYPYLILFLPASSGLRRFIHRYGGRLFPLGRRQMRTGGSSKGQEAMLDVDINRSPFLVGVLSERRQRSPSEGAVDSSRSFPSQSSELHQDNVGAIDGALG